jgi:hypothetical protein
LKIDLPQNQAKPETPVTAAPADTGRRGSPYDTVIVACGLVSIGIAAVYWVMRIGFDDPVLLVARQVALALFIFTFPATVSGTLFRKSYKESSSAVRWWSSYPFLWLMALALTADLGRLVSATGLNAFPFVAAVGVLSFAIVFVRWLPRATAWRTLALITGCAAFSIWASGVVWGRIYKNPLFYENYILDGRAHHDSLVPVAFGNMLRTYHVATTGIDGLNYVPYHWGTAWLFAQWSSLTGAHVLDFYQLGFPVTMIPFFFGGVLALAVALRSRRGGVRADDDLRNDSRIWFVFLAACIGIIPISGLDAMGVWTSNLLISESYTVAVPCALLLLVATLLWYDGTLVQPGRRASAPGKIADSIFILAGLPVGIALLGYLKSSLMMLAFALALYAFVRLGLYRRIIYWCSLAVTTLLFIVTYHRVILPAHREGLAPFDFLWSYVRPAWWPFFIVVHLFWSWLYILVRLRSEGIGTLADLREAASERRILDVEAVAVVALLGIGPGLVTHIDGGSAFYFSDVQRWLSVGFILSRIPDLFATVFGETQSKTVRRRRNLMSRLDAISVRSVVLAFLLLPVLGSMISNSVVWPMRMVRANAETRHALYPPSLGAGIPHGFHGLPRLGDPAVLNEGLRRSPNFVVADALRRLSAMPDSSRRRTALFIPQDQAAYWKSLTREGACTFQSFVAPALASLAMIDGMPPYRCVLSRYYGIGSFAPRTRPQLPEESKPATLCRRAATWGMDRVIVLTFDDSHAANATTIECAPQR